MSAELHEGVEAYASERVHREMPGALVQVRGFILGVEVSVLTDTGESQTHVLYHLPELPLTTTLGMAELLRGVAQARVDEWVYNDLEEEE